MKKMGEIEMKRKKRINLTIDAEYVIKEMEITFIENEEEFIQSCL